MIQVVPPDFRTVSIEDGTRQLTDAYRKALAVADRLGLTRVAFPLLSADSYRGAMAPRTLWDIAERTLRTTPTAVEVLYLVRFAPTGGEVTQLEEARKRRQRGAGGDQPPAGDAALAQHRETYLAAVSRLAEPTIDLARRWQMDQAPTEAPDEGPADSPLDRANGLITEFKSLSESALSQERVDELGGLFASLLDLRVAIRDQIQAQGKRGRRADGRRQIADLIHQSGGGAAATAFVGALARATEDGPVRCLRPDRSP